MRTHPVRSHTPRHVTAGLFVPMQATLRDARMPTPTERLLTVRLENGRTLGHQPGQFVQVSVFGLEEAPISVCSAARDDGAFELCVRRIGRLTGALHALEPGGQVGIRGPFGRGFPLEDLAGKDVVFIAGGIGLAPMRSLIQHCLAHRGDFAKLALLYGAKRPAELLFREDLSAWAGRGDLDVLLTVDAAEGDWSGSVGLITALVRPLEIDSARTAAVVVGPPVMYRPVIAELHAKGLGDERIVLSLERHMRCGVGKCGHCMIDDAYYCCRDGPVFTLKELAGLEGAI